MSEFDYILHNINDADFIDAPFRHIYLENFFSERHFGEIIKSREVNIGAVQSDEQLIAELHARDFREIPFPGTTTDIPTYLRWHKDRQNQENVNQKTCEGFGVTFRLQQTAAGSFLREVGDFFASAGFWAAAAKKHGIKVEDTRSDFGLQKYLDGYEISPHPDIRKKALTFMININPAPDSENLDYHTRYLTFKPERSQMLQSWITHQDVDRGWVPWDWCDIHKQQSKNNSLVMFSPSNYSLHAVKASYDHLTTQRTQYYGNLWFK